MTYSELQKALKEMRDVQGYTLEVKLNAKKEALQAEYDRITLLINDSQVEEVEITEELNGQTCELTSAVRLPKVLDLQFFADNYSCELPVQTETVTSQSEYWSEWEKVYSKAITKLGDLTQMPSALDREQTTTQQESSLEPSFGAVLITAASIVLDGVKCFADMAKQVFKAISKKRKKAVGFA